MRSVKQMKKIKGLMILFIIATLILGIVEVPVRANDFEVSIEFSEDFKKWEQLSDEEKANTLMPNITANNIADKNILLSINILLSFNA